jgi:Uma2 family endonuclease
LNFGNGVATIEVEDAASQNHSEMHAVSIVESSSSLADVIEQLGNIELSRIRMHPPPGTATAEDVDAINVHEDRLFELVDGILVEKVMGFRESLVAMRLARMLGDFASAKNLGLVVGADGMMRPLPKTVRIPDVSFIGWDQLPGGKVPKEAVPPIAPSLAVEVLGDSNTPGEMSRKRDEYFAAGVTMVWEVDIERRSVAVYTAANACEVIQKGQTLRAESCLPGLEIPVDDIFAELDRTAS